jgi:hypothetical protein
MGFKMMSICHTNFFSFLAALKFLIYFFHSSDWQDGPRSISTNTFPKESGTLFITGIIIPCI